ncbi:MAG: dehydrogenase [Proteobacteria bacterium]|nr:dehydrogenase [Pseudomonadota bacterium]MBI3499277.1 dehydrogenase [Pseudomonadota bacterium]
MADLFRVGITRDALDDKGNLTFDASALKLLDEDKRVTWEYLSDRGANVTADHLAKYDAICMVAPGVQADAVGRADMRTRLLARLGVGYDHIDVPAVTKAGLVLTINPDGVRRPVATVQLTYMLALAHRMLIKDKLTREGRWNDRHDHVGTGLTGRVLGSIGIGNIGAELFRLAKPLEMRHMAHDPFAKPTTFTELGVEPVDFDTVVSQSDFLVVNCPLNAKTRRLIDAKVIQGMKPTAFLINCARGPIVDEKALTEALTQRRIAGAGIDVFEEEPTPPDNPLLKLDNVIVSPHALTYTDECLRRLAEGSFRSVRRFLDREPPHLLVNPDVMQHARVKEWYKAN